MQSIEYEEPKYIITGLIRTGRRRISILGGQPQVGKSTLAMFIAVCVAKGICFFDRATTKGAVLYWQCEEDLYDLRDSFRKLGYDPATDAPIYVLNDSGKNTLENLNDALEAHPDVVLVIIETLDDLLKTKDIKENSDVRKSFEEFDTKVLSKHYKRVAFLALHHLKKRETDDRGQMLLGASIRLSHRFQRMSKDGLRRTNRAGSSRPRPNSTKSYTTLRSLAVCGSVNSAVFMLKTSTSHGALSMCAGRCGRASK